MTDISEAIRASLKKTFGYEPLPFEKWVVYKHEWLIVISADKAPRVYRCGCEGKFNEIQLELR